MRLRDLLTDVEVRSVRGDDDCDVTSVAHDSRTVASGALFCCIPGATDDGHDHAAAAVAAGAVALVVERYLDVDVPQVLVGRVRNVIGPLAAALYEHPSRSLRLVGVTGTNGKTTTTYLLDAIGAVDGSSTGLIGTVETRVGAATVDQPRTTPEAPELQALLANMVESGVVNAAMEVSSHALDMGRVRGTSFAAACFTNLSHDHLDYHHSIAEYFQAKASLFAADYTHAAAVNVDDAYGAVLSRRALDSGLSVTTFGLSESADITATDVDCSIRGTRMTLLDRRQDRRASLETALVGRFNVMNVLAAAAAALAAGYGWSTVHEGLSTPVRVPGRMELVGDAQFSVLVDYAHTPDALERVLDAVRELTATGSQVTVVFGAGGDRDREKRPRMGEVAAHGADHVVVTSDNPRSEDPDSIIDQIVAGTTSARSVTREPDRRLAIRLALAGAGAGDVVVIAGKGHETGQTAGGRTRPFDDRLVARQELERVQCS